jgi:hypothetical protein
MDQKRLDETLLKIGQFSEEKISWAELQNTIDNEAAIVLKDQGLSGIQATRMVAGRFRLRIINGPLTPAGQSRLTALQAK